jgi:hypothetical protein
MKDFRKIFQQNKRKILEKSFSKIKQKNERF